MTFRNSTTATFAAAAGITLAVGMAIQHGIRRRQRSKWVEKEANENETETLPSIIEHFRGYELTEETTIEEANKRRTTCYYEKARDAHVYDLVAGVRSYPRLRNRREAELARIMKYYRKGDQSHRTVLVMCDSMTSSILDLARQSILRHLNYSTDKTTEEAWIPEESIIPESHMHVTVITPWWWHTIREGNTQLSQELVARFRQALVVGFHHPFQIELERIVLLGGKTLVALWRTVGHREMEDGTIIYDRHGAELDPMARLRREIIHCFTEGASELGLGEPLTYAHRKSAMPATPTNNDDGRDSLTSPPPLPKPETVKRVNTIEKKTPGMASSDGFIHTTLARLPLDCLSMTDIELGPIHRLCREATATYCGHRMVVSKFRFLETMGAGGESNPCQDPIFDETIEAPTRFEVTAVGINENLNLHVPKNLEQRGTIGAPANVAERRTMSGLFEAPQPSREHNHEHMD